jgi:hypothetical protein
MERISDFAELLRNYVLKIKVRNEIDLFEALVGVCERSGMIVTAEPYRLLM